MNNIVLIILAFGFVLLNGFFVAAEFAMVKLRHSRVQIIKKTNGMRGRVLYQIHSNLDAYLSACQLGITLASLGLGWVGEPAFAHILEPLFYRLNITSTELIKLISFVVAFALISYSHIVIGELMPKSMAIRQSEKISLWTAVPLYIFYWVMYPFISFLNYSAMLLLKLFRLDATHHGDHHYTSAEIKFILKTAHDNSGLTQANKDMLIRMLEFSNVQAVDIMRPIEELISIDQANNLEKKLQIIKKYRFTRYPVYQNTPENFIGILHTKDLLLDINQNTLRPLVKVQRKTRAVEILEKFREGKPHFAIIYYRKKPIGFITLDNILHVLIGKMRDEFHLTNEDWYKLPDGSYLIKGSSPVYIIEKLMDVDLSAYPADTVGGLLLHSLEKFPQAGDTWSQPKFILAAEKIEKQRILEVRLIPVA